MARRHTVIVDTSNPRKVFASCKCGDWSTGPHCDEFDAKEAHRSHQTQRAPHCGTCNQRHHGRYCPEGIPT